MSPRSLLAAFAALALVHCATPTNGHTTRSASPPDVCPKPEPHVPSAASSAKVAEGDARASSDLDAAIDAYTQATEADNENVAAFVALGRALMRSARREEAAQALRRAAFLAPKRAELWHELASLYVEDGLETHSNEAWLEANEVLRRCLDVVPSHAGCHALLGTTRLYLDDEQGALEAYTNSLEFDPTQLGVYLDLTSLYLNLNYASQARTVAEQGLSFAPESSPLHVELLLLLSRACQRGRDFEGSAAALERASKLATDRPEILFKIGRGYLDLQPPHKEQAAHVLREFLARACKKGPPRQVREQCGDAMAWLARLGAP